MLVSAVLLIAALLVLRSSTTSEEIERRGDASERKPLARSLQPTPSSLADSTRPEPSAREAQPPARDPAATVRVEGVVLDNLGGPIEGAHIAARQQAVPHALPVALARSDEQGRFTLWLRPGRVPEHAALLWLNARAEGYAEATVVVRVPTRAARLALFPESLLAGVVETESGEPVPNVAVELGPPPLSLLPSWPRAVTDEHGRFEFRSLAPGSYRPFVDDGRWHARLDRIELGFVERRDDLRIVVREGHLVRVDVRAPDGSACLEPRARIVGLERDGSERDEDGFIMLAAIPSGAHRLIAGCRGALEVEQAVEIRADSTFEITTAEGLMLRGRTIDERGDPVPGALVRADPTRSGLAHSSDVTESDQLGEFELRGLTPGKRIVTATRSDRLDAPPVELELLADAAAPELTLQLARGHCISGDVQGGPDELVVVARSGERSPTNLRLGPERRFELCGFESEGRLWLEDGVARMQIPFLHNADELQQLELQFPAASERPLALRVAASSEHTLQIHVEANGARVDEALVRLGPRSGPASPLRCGRPFPLEVIRHGVADDGTLMFEELWPGRYYVHAEAEGAQGCAVVSLDERSPAITIELAR